MDQICEITGEKTLFVHLNEIKPVLYLSTNQQNVEEAINAGEALRFFFFNIYFVTEQFQLYTALFAFILLLTHYSIYCIANTDALWKNSQNNVHFS